MLHQTNIEELHTLQIFYQQILSIRNINAGNIEIDKLKLNNKKRKSPIVPNKTIHSFPFPKQL